MQLGAFTARPPHAGQRLYIYRDSAGRPCLRPYASTTCHPGQPCRNAFRVLMYLTWGPPPVVMRQLGRGLERPLRMVACHFACDHHGCMNPCHGRWGTDRENLQEYFVLREYYASLSRLPFEQREAFRAEHHPARVLLAAQGFPLIR